MAYIWKCLLVEGAIYVFFVFEQIATSMKCCGSSNRDSTVMEMSPTANGHRKSSLRSSFKNTVQPSESKTELANHEAKMGEDMEEATTENEDYCVKGCNSVAMMIILGDSLHNFGDGLAIGASFTVSIAAGLSTSIAILCHELPHELGDLAVLLNQGMRLRTALLMNLLSAFTAFIGLWVGIPLGLTVVAREWIFAAVAGIFLYVGLVSMLPMLHRYNGKSDRGTIAILQHIGFLAGIAIILLIALYEDAIAVSL